MSSPVASVLGKILSPIRAGLKALTVRFASTATWWNWGTYSPSTYDYAGRVGDGSSSSIVMATVFWIARNFPDAPLQVVRKQADGSVEVQEGHPLTELWRRPNPYYSGIVMTMAFISDFVARGNGYIWKIRSGAGRVVQLWYIPQSIIEPKWDTKRSDEFISHYEYRYDGAKEPLKIPAEDIYHQRWGIDPNNSRKGLSPLASLYQEIYTDLEAANWVSSLLRNSAGPSVIIAPDTDDKTMTETKALKLKANFIEKFGGANRGEPMIVQTPVKVTPFSFSPEQMNLREQRRVPEERVTAVLGVPAVVVGLGAGLDRSTFANMAEAREAAFENGIVPLQRLILEDLTVQMLEEFADTSRFALRFDNSQVRILQEDLNKMADRIGKLVAVYGLLTVGEGKVELGMDSGPEDDYYLRPAALHAVPRAEAGLAPPAPVMPPQLLPPRAPEEDEQPAERDLVAAALGDRGWVKAAGSNGHGG